MSEVTRPLRVGLVSVRFKLFDEQMGDDFPGRILAHAERSASLLEQCFEVVNTAHRRCARTASIASGDAIHWRLET